MALVRFNFLNWRPDQDEFNTDGLQIARNVLHDTEGYKSILHQTGGAFSVDTFYTGITLHSVRAMQIRNIGSNATKVAALAQDRATTAAMVDMSIGVEGESAAFTSIPSATLISAGGVRIRSFSVAETEYGSVGIAASWNASLQSGGFTIYSLSGEAIFTVLSETDAAPGVSATTSLDGTQASHSQTRVNADCFAGIYVKNDGNEYSVGNDNTSEGTLLSAWLDSGVADSLYINLSLTSGTLAVDAGQDTWLSLSASRKWAIQQTSAATGTAAVSISIATDSGGMDVIDTATYNLQAIRENVTISNAEIEDNSSPSTTVGVRFNTDGTVDQRKGGVFTQINATTDWIIPNASADTSYYVKLTVISGDSPSTGPAVDTWVQLTSAQAWALTETSTTINTAVWDISISNDAGTTTLDTGRFTMIADNT